MPDPNIPDRKFLDAFKAFRTDCRRTEVRIITILTFEKRILQVSCNCIIADTNVVFVLKKKLRVTLAACSFKAVKHIKRKAVPFRINDDMLFCIQLQTAWKAA